MLLISMVVALLAALQLGDFFDASGEFGLVILGVVAFTIFSLAVFALAYALTRRAACSPSSRWSWPSRLRRWRCRACPEDRRPLDQSLYRGRREHLHHARTGRSRRCSAVLVQWGLVRRRWLQALAPRI